ncbi:hypothetical protein GCM10009606_34390 [Nocardioides aquiterrae]|uniref:CN hydrolase domain-containing protein n=1 Tax=Nocardioides aquiterrae TaxID=203799 RepID=A0ABN1UI77_9ACTN
MIAPMFGITMFDRNVPKRWTWTRAEARCAAAAGVDVVVAIAPSLDGPDCEPGHTDLCLCLYAARIHPVKGLFQHDRVKIHTNAVSSPEMRLQEER